MSFLSFFTRPRVKNPTAGNLQFVKGDLFTPGAEIYAAEPTVTDPAYTMTVFPQWNFTPLEVYQTAMVFQNLSLPQAPPQGFPFGGMLQTGLMHDDDIQTVSGDIWS